MPPANPEARAPKARPDPRPMRVALGLTGLVAATAMLTAIVRPSGAGATAAPSLDPLAGASPEPTAAPLTVRHVTHYVTLKPGESAPAGARVVQKPEASPRVVIVTITAPPARQIVVNVAAPQPVVTRQSGVK